MLNPLQWILFLIEVVDFLDKEMSRSNRNRLR
jgi:hypothetical protein